MSYISVTIPAAPVLIPVAGLLGVRAWRRTAGARIERLRAVALPWAVIAYGAAAFSVTLFPLVFASDVGSMQVPWTAYVNLVPLVHAEPSAFVQNIALTVPLGILGPLCSRRIDTLADAARLGFTASLAIELTQLLLDVLIGTGHIADVDDLLANVIGAAAGFAAFGLRPRAVAGTPPSPRTSLPGRR